MSSQDRFSYEWVKFQELTPEYETQFLKWVTPLTRKDFKSKSVLDAGCGAGRNSYWPLVYGAKEVVAFDFDKKTIAVAKRNLSRFKNVKIEYKSIYDISYRNKFDISLAIGVIHHLQNPKQAVKKLVTATKKGGRVLLWVYGYEGNEWIPKWINPIRKSFTSKLPLSAVYLLSLLISLLFFSYLKLIPQKRPYLKQLSTFKFWHIHSIVFDQLIPRVANYWTKEQALDLFDKLPLKNVRITHVNSMSWALIGTKK